MHALGLSGSCQPPQLAPRPDVPPTSTHQARQLFAWRQTHVPLAIAELTEDDRRILDANHRARLVEVVQKHCTAALKAIMQHKVWCAFWCTHSPPMSPGRRPSFSLSLPTRLAVCRRADLPPRPICGSWRCLRRAHAQWAFPFNLPVDTQRFPDYPKVVAVPMDFATIKARLDSSHYVDPKDWMSDLMLVFTNAKRYNPLGSDCFLMAQTLQVQREPTRGSIPCRWMQRAITIPRKGM